MSKHSRALYFPVIDNDFFAKSSLWSKLAFVKSQRAYWMGGDVWLFGGPLSAEVLTDTVLTAMQVELPTTTLEATPDTK